MVNEGKGGRPTASRSDFDAMLARQPRIDLLVIALGMNDSRDITVSCVPKAVANVRYMIERARQTCGAALPILLVGPSNINKAALGPTKPIARQREAKLRRAWRRLCEPRKGNELRLREPLRRCAGVRPEQGRRSSRCGGECGDCGRDEKETHAMRRTICWSNRALGKPSCEKR